MNYDDIVQTCKPTQILKDHLVTYLYSIDEYKNEKALLETRLYEVNVEIASLSVLLTAVENELNRNKDNNIYE